MVGPILVLFVVFFCSSVVNSTDCSKAVVYSTDRSKAVVLVLFLLFAVLRSFVVPALLFFSICVVMLALWSPSSIAAHFAFCFTSVVGLAIWPPSTAAHFAFCFTSCN